MVLSARAPNPLYPYSYEVKGPQLGIRDFIVLTLGALDSPISEEKLFVLTKNFVNHINVEFSSPIYIKNIFLSMINKLHKNNIITNTFDSDIKSYRVLLSAKGSGELDAILFSKNFIIPKWNKFKEFAILAAS